MNTMEGQGQESTITDERQLQDDDYQFAYQEVKDAVEWLENTTLIGPYDGKKWASAIKFVTGMDIPNTYTKPLIKLD